MDLRKEVEGFISRAVDSVKHYNGQEYDQNRHNWVQITTDRIIYAVMNSLPDPIDVRTKYETDRAGGIALDITHEDDEHDKQQMDYLANYAEDQGFNKYYFAYTEYLRGLYNTPGGVIQSGNEQDRIHGTSEGDSTNDKEQSKVR